MGECTVLSVWKSAVCLAVVVCFVDVMGTVKQPEAKDKLSLANLAAEHRLLSSEKHTRQLERRRGRFNSFLHQLVRFSKDKRLGVDVEEILFSDDKHSRPKRQATQNAGERNCT